MPWYSVSFEVNAETAERLADALADAGALAVDISDAAAGTAAEQPVFDEPGQASDRSWVRARLTALFPGDVEPGARVARAVRAAGLADVPFGVATVDDQDWVRLTQSQFTPQQVAGRLWIVPTWHVAPDPDAINIVLDPGLAFGTGTHPTTRLCLRWLAAHLSRGETVIDYGCGSGILAIAALKLGAAAAQGVDVDEQALLAARYNAAQNQVRATFHDAAERLERPAHVVVANILANPLRVLAPLIADLTKAGGRVVLSGILDGQAAEVRSAYEPWFNMDAAETEDEWVLLSGTRK